MPSLVNAERGGTCAGFCVLGVTQRLLGVYV